MKNKGVVVMAAAVAVLGGYLAYDMKAEKAADAKKAEESRLFVFKPDQVNEFAIEGSKGRTVLKRSVDGWTIEEPLKDGADDGFTDDFVERSMGDKFLEIAKEGADIDWKVYGLDAPVAKITFKSQAGAASTLEISAKQNFEQNAIARISGENRVLIVPAAWSVNAGRGPNDFRDKRLLRFKIGSVDRLEFKNALGSFVIESKDGKWSAPGRPDAVLEQNRVRELMSMINETRAQDFADPAAAGKSPVVYGLAAPAVTMTARLKDKIWSAKLGRGTDPDKSEYALVGEPKLLLKLETGAIDKFGRTTLDGLRDKKIPFAFDRAAAVRLETRSGLKTSAYRKDGATWAIVDGASGVTADSAKIDELLERLAKLQALRYADAKEAAKFKPANSLAFAGADGGEVFRLEWGAPYKGKTSGQDLTFVLAKSSASPDVFELEESTLTALPLKELAKAPEGAKTAPKTSGDAPAEKPSEKVEQ